MTDEQIMQGLKWCYQVEGSCGNCPYRPKNKEEVRCIDRLGNDVIGLIERLQAEIERLTEMLNATIAGQETLQRHINVARAEAIKEFADKLIEEGTADGAYGYVGVLAIDIIAKEMVGADNG